MTCTLVTQPRKFFAEELCWASLKGNKSQTSLKLVKTMRAKCNGAHNSRQFCCVNERRSQAKSDFILQRQLTFSSSKTLTDTAYIYKVTPLLASLLYVTHIKDKVTHMCWLPSSFYMPPVLRGGLTHMCACMNVCVSMLVCVYTSMANSPQASASLFV